MYKWPIELALTIAVEETYKYLNNYNTNIEKVHFIVNDERLEKAYQFLIDKYSN